MSSGAFDTVLADLKKQVEAIGDVDIRTRLLQQLEDLERQVLGNKNPFKLLVNSIKAYNAAADGTPEKSKKFSQMFESIADSIGFVKEGFDSVVNGLKELGMAGDGVTQEMLGDISNMIGGAGQLAKGIATSNPMDMIQGALALSPLPYPYLIAPAAALSVKWLNTKSSSRHCNVYIAKLHGV